MQEPSLELVAASLWWKAVYNNYMFGDCFLFFLQKVAIISEI